MGLPAWRLTFSHPDGDVSVTVRASNDVFAYDAAVRRLAMDKPLSWLGEACLAGEEIVS